MPQAGLPWVRIASAARRLGLAGLVVLGLMTRAPAAHAQALMRFEEAPLREVIAEIEARTRFRFLYRDALVTGRRLSFVADTTDVLDALEAALRPHGLGLQVDSARAQVLLAPRRPEERGTAAVLTGQVLDAEHGTRLPFATLTWHQDGARRGMAADDTGAFRLDLEDLRAAAETLVLTVSYVGYQARRVRIDLADVPRELSIRLVPAEAFGPEVIVRSSSFETDLDTAFHGTVQRGLGAPLGETSVVRAMSHLPAVGLTPAFASGLYVRGSRADGFQILLDGTSIYNPHHFFGLFDAFNEDALQTVGLYYGVAPAAFEAPPGGTLSFVTRTGSQTRRRLHLGLSNAAYRGTAEGPLARGRGSWLVSGRRSYLDALGWFNSDALVAQALGAGRPAALRPGVRRLTDDASARFYDLHGKLFVESARGHRWTLNGYRGGDRTRLRDETFLLPRPPFDPDTLQIERVAAETGNRWRNEAASLQHSGTFGARTFVRSLLALSHFASRYAKDDFLYTLPPTAPGEPPETFDGFFGHDNDLRDLKWSQHLARAPRAGGTWTAGYTIHRFRARYEETSSLRRPAPYAETQRSTQLDLFAEVERTPATGLDVRAGLRSHYFSEGGFLRLSPRLHLRYTARPGWDVSAGYSRNHQFLHRLYLEHVPSSDVWILSTADEPPGRADHLTAGLHVTPRPDLAFQVEAYAKRSRNVRQHETIARRRADATPSLFLAPWLHDLDARARGLEVLLRHRLGPLRLTHGYTLSKAEVRHEALARGRYVRADWDRRHQLSTRLDAGGGPWRLRLTGLAASGAPNTLAGFDAGEASSLPRYARLDASLHYRRRLGSATLEATAAVYNLLDRRNVWYRETTLFDAGERLRLRNVDVYDLGFQPSFGLTIGF